MPSTFEVVLQGWWRPRSQVVHYYIIPRCIGELQYCQTDRLTKDWCNALYCTSILSFVPESLQASGESRTALGTVWFAHRFWLESILLYDRLGCVPAGRSWSTIGATDRGWFVQRPSYQPSWPPFCLVRRSDVYFDRPQRGL